MERRKRVFGFPVAALLVACLLSGACLPASPTATPELTVLPVAVASISRVFAPFEEPAATAVPAVHHEPIAPDLGNIRVPFVLSQA